MANINYTEIHFSGLETIRVYETVQQIAQKRMKNREIMVRLFPEGDPIFIEMKFTNYCKPVVVDFNKDPKLYRSLIDKIIHQSNDAKRH